MKKIIWLFLRPCWLRRAMKLLTSAMPLTHSSLIRDSDLDLVITDMKMPGMNGMELLEECKKIKPELPVIIMTAYGTIEMAVEAMKKHAYDLHHKAFSE